MKIWLDDVREAPFGFFRCYSVNQAKTLITAFDKLFKLGDKEYEIQLISCDHDMGDYYNDGGDGIELVKLLVNNDFVYPIQIHSMNPVGRANMQAVLDNPTHDVVKDESSPDFNIGDCYNFRVRKDSEPELVRLDHYNPQTGECHIKSVKTGKYRTTNVKRLSVF